MTTTNTRHNELLKLANDAIASQLPQKVTLREKGNEWEVTCPPAECWLEWGLGKGWYNVVAIDGHEGVQPPDWAMDLRAEWDSAWA